MYRFIHSSDLHIGKRFGNLEDEDLRGRLREARHGAIDRLAAQARTNDAAAILLAGDTFDTETPSPAILRQALAAMAAHAPLRFVILPGNHDSLVADELWAAMRKALPDNVTLAVEPVPLSLASGIVLLPAPCTARRPGRDLSEWMDGADTADGAIRIGLAHGAIQNFSEDDAGTDVIAPDRATRARLDYLALGDWHGQMQVNARTWYSGAPEPDRFKHRIPGQALLVALEAPGAPPVVTPVPSAQFAWQMLDLDLLADDDAASLLSARLASGPLRRQTLLRVTLTGRCSLAGRTALAAALEAVKPEFALLDIDDDNLVTECAQDDLDAIDRSGALRQAAETLMAESTDEARDPATREIARQALLRLFSYSGGTGP